MFFLNSMWLTEDGKDVRNQVCWGYFDTMEEAKAKACENWNNMHEHWNNTVLIEFVPKGFAPHLQVTRSKLQRWWFKAQGETLDTSVLVPIEQPNLFKNVGLLSM